MPSELSPFVEANYGWPFGSDGWNTEMDGNLVKFSYLHDRNIDAIVSSLPAISDGTAYFNTTDNRLYFDANGQRYSSVTPKWFEVTLRTTGQVYQFDGSVLVLNPAAAASTAYTDALRDDIAAPTGSGEVGHIRSALNSAITTARQMLNAQHYNIYEFAESAGGYVEGGDPTTWNWTGARVAANTFIKTFGATGGGVIVYPPGTYPHTVFVREDGITSVGSGSASCFVTSLPYAPGGDFGLVEIGSGAITSSHLKGFTFLGSATVGFGLPPVNPTQWGMYIKAKWDAAYTHGGLWYSIHEDLRFGNFNLGMWSRGGYTNNNFLRPNQWLTFKNVMFQVPTGGEAIRLTGQHGQIAFSNGAAEGRDGAVALRCITLDYDPDPATMADNASGHGESTSDVAGVGQAIQVPISPIFADGFSMQKAQEGVFARITKGAVIKGVYIENIGKLATLSSGAQLHISSSRLANAADGTLFSSAGNGYLWSLASSASLTFADDNNITGTTDNYSDPTVNLNNIVGVHAHGGVSGNPSGKYKYNAFKTLSLTTSTIDLSGHKFAVVNSGTDKTVKLTTVNSIVAPDETVMLRPTTGPITLGTGGNISLNGLSEITFPAFWGVELLRIPQVGGSGEFIVKNKPDHYAAAEPADGYYYADGTKVWNTNVVAGASPGWIVTTAGLAGTTAVFKAMAAVAA